MINPQSSKHPWLSCIAIALDVFAIVIIVIVLCRAVNVVIDVVVRCTVTIVGVVVARWPSPSSS